MSNSNSAVPGVFTVFPSHKRTGGGGDFIRVIENQLIHKEGTFGREKPETAKFELCVARLPKGTNCENRIEKNGFFFCAGVNSDCPLSKERV